MLLRVVTSEQRLLRQYVPELHEYNEAVQFHPMGSRLFTSTGQMMACKSLMTIPVNLAICAIFEIRVPT